MLPVSVGDLLRSYGRQKRGLRPKVGFVRFGSLRRVMPVSSVWGYDRGKPVDRYYIESFLEQHASDIRGRVLELQDNTYTTKFGGSRVTRSDVLCVKDGEPNATIVADLTSAPHLPSDTFDCIIFTQALQFMYDLHAALSTLHRILKPSGVILATVPGITPVDRGDPGVDQYWSFTPEAVGRLFKEAFPGSPLSIEFYGNVLSSISFLEGLACNELRRDELDRNDPRYPVVIAIRAQKLPQA